MMNCEEVTLIQPSIAFESAYRSMAEEFWAKESWVAGENRFQNDRDLIENNFSAYIRRLDEENQSIGLKPGYVPSTTFWLAANNTQIIGESRLRHWLTTSLEHEGGHIGYVIRPSAATAGIRDVHTCADTGKSQRFRTESRVADLRYR